MTNYGEGSNASKDRKGRKQRRSLDNHLTKPIEILKVCLVEGVPHYLNVHIIQVLPKETQGKVCCKEE